MSLAIHYPIKRVCLTSFRLRVWDFFLFRLNCLQSGERGYSNAAVDAPSSQLSSSFPSFIIIVDIFLSFCSVSFRQSLRRHHQLLLHTFNFLWAMTTVKLLRGQPPSPPQSPNGASTPDSQLESCMAFNPAYAHPESMGMNGHSTMKLAYDSDPQPLVSFVMFNNWSASGSAFTNRRHSRLIHPPPPTTCPTVTTRVWCQCNIR